MGTRMDRDPKAKCPHHCSGVTWGWDGTWDQDKGWDGITGTRVGLGATPWPRVPITTRGVTRGWDNGTKGLGMGPGPQGQVSPSLQWGDVGMGGDMGLGWGLGWDHGDQDGTRTPKPSVPITTRGVTQGWDNGTMGLGWENGTKGIGMGPGPKAKCVHHCNGVTWGWERTAGPGWGLGWDHGAKGIGMGLGPQGQESPSLPEE